MLGERFRRCSLCLLLVAALAFASCPVVTATTIEEAQQKDKELKEKKKQTQADKQALSEQLNTLIAQMADTEKKLSAKQEEIKKAEEDLVAAKVKENDQYNSMKLRIRYMYECGDFSLMSAFFEAQSITDLLNRVEYASEMSDYDRQMLESYKEVVRQIADQEAKLKEQYAALEVLQDQLTAQRDQVQALLAEKEMQLADLEKEIGANAAELDKLMKQSRHSKRRRRPRQPRRRVRRRRQPRPLRPKTGRLQPGEIPAHPRSPGMGSLHIPVRAHICQVALATEVLTTHSTRDMILPATASRCRHTLRQTERSLLPGGATRRATGSSSITGTAW